MPPKIICLCAFLKLKCSNEIYGKDYFITGTDSPVSIASLTIKLPESKIRSQGKLVDSGTIIMSPGISYELSTSSIYYSPLLLDIFTFT